MPLYAEVQTATDYRQQNIRQSHIRRRLRQKYYNTVEFVQQNESTPLLIN